ncbi:BTAD domain-containing putative transcriptional regulator [Streptomyces sp. G-G2]|uniref:AfsR/SARP family transcriptional regulator n=1 Tax=Streptomyces sp. G-G2 TaxID=3046201 RepID=UPI0024BB898F|nr:BTAD domain-containing putative transcriptional regulator [Streptomyces sp. G-G2]MDJ0382262.1 BTAD domain-containing putative transcriptional regulator [Streptomyces sp. G-G2]
MDFTILGPVSARAAGRAVALDGSKQRTVLAALLLARGKVMTDERLTTLLWGWEPPASSTNQLYTYVSRLRTRLGARHGLERIGSGYRMDIGDAGFDWDDFRRLVDAGGADLTAGRYEDAERRLAAALALWRGPALTDVTARLAEAEGPRMEEVRLSALEQHTEAALALGRHADTVPGLTRQVALHPVRERLRGHLMTALFRCGRQADALAVYEEGRRVLAEDLGIDPGPELRALHQRVLTGTLPAPQAPERPCADPARSGAAPARGPGEADSGAAAAVALPRPARPAPGRDGWPGLVPALLPAAPGDFTGREEESAEILAALRAHQDVVITGAPGTGTSALALRAAELSRAAFPDGQLYADLRTPEGGARTTGEVLGWFLRALGADPARLPEGLDERVQLYRTLLAGRRVFVVLDNADDDAQVRPLLPGGDSRTIVTGPRSPLASLEGTRLVRTGPMTPRESLQLMMTVAGPGRISDDLESAARIAEFCDRLPLALRIAGARLAARPQWSAARLAARLAPEERRLAELRLGGLDVRATLSRAVDRLPFEVRGAFGVLAAAGWRDLGAADAAALLGTGVDDAEEMLEQLTDAQLADAWGVDGDARPRYRFTRLVRLFAQERSSAVLLAA